MGRNLRAPRVTEASWPPPQFQLYQRMKWACICLTLVQGLNQKLWSDWGEQLQGLWYNRGRSFWIVHSQQALFKLLGKEQANILWDTSSLDPSPVILKSPDDSPVLVSMNRSEDRVNRYFRYQRTDPGLVMESCCEPMNLIFSECPMSINPITFRSSCKWLSKRFTHETSGVVFAQHRSLILPLSISGINIVYDGSGEISSGLSPSPVSSCSTCPSNERKILTEKPLSPPDCYFYQFDSGDAEDMLKSNSLAYTFTERIARLLPSWVSVSVPNNTCGSTSFYDTDIAASLVKQEDVAGISGCESISADNPGLYIVLRYGRGFEVSVGGGSVRYSPTAPTNSHPVCVAVNLCQEVESPIYLGLPDDVQSIVRQLPALVPLNRDGWQYSVESVTIYKQAQQVTIPNRYWNGTEIYSPEAFNPDLRMKTTASINFDSFLNGLISIKVNYAGEVSSDSPNDQVYRYII